MNGSNEPAFPCPVGHSKCDHPEGLSLRQYAAIKLRVPDSGDPWLDDMIRESLRNEFAGQAMVGYIHDWMRMNSQTKEVLGPTATASMCEIASHSYRMADAMLAQQSRREASGE